MRPEVLKREIGTRNRTRTGARNQASKFLVLHSEFYQQLACLYAGIEIQTRTYSLEAILTTD